MAVSQGSGQVLPDQQIIDIGDKRTFLNHFVHFLVVKKLGAFGLFVALLLIVSAVFAPLIANHDPFVLSVDNIYAPPGIEHYFGGDHLGRDVFSRIIYGTRISLVVGLFSSFIGLSLIHI